MAKLLIITDTWIPQTNGIATVFAAVVAELEKRGHAVTVVHPGLFTRTFPLPLYPELPFVLFPGARMRALFDQERPEYVHIATEASLGLSARRICRERNIAFTTSYHTNFPLYARHYFWFGGLFSLIASRYLRWFHRGARAVLVSTASLRDQLKTEGYGEVVVWPFGVDTERFVRDESRAPETNLARPIFTYLGRVANEKGVEEFLQSELPGTKVVIGDGPARGVLETRYGHHAHFVGYKQGQELVDWLSLTDVCVFPSRTETFGLVVLEMLACGVPVAAHDVMGPRDIITHGVDGTLGEDLAQGALACLSLSREACRETALRYSWSASVDVFLRHIKTYV